MYYVYKYFKSKQIRRFSFLDEQSLSTKGPFPLSLQLQSQILHTHTPAVQFRICRPILRSNRLVKDA